MVPTQADRRLAWATLIFFKPHGWARKAFAALKCAAAVNGELILECGPNCIGCIRLPRRKRSRHLRHLLFPLIRVLPLLCSRGGRDEVWKESRVRTMERA
jgi:hypothetical protein